MSVAWIAAAVATWAVLCLLLVTLDTLGLYGASTAGGMSFRELFGYALIVLPLALVVQIVVARPIHAWFVRTRRRNASSYALLGVAAGMSPFLFYVFFSTVASLRTHSPELAEWRFGLSWALLGVPCGVAGALVFWFVGVRDSERETPPG